MSKSKFRPLTLQEFIWLVQSAQTTHATRKEPIPLLLNSQHGNADSSLKTPFQTYGNQQLYPGFIKKAAILFYLLNKNHALSNGNKRMACLALGYFCSINGKQLTITPGRFYVLAKYVTESAAGKKDFIVTRIEAILKPYII